ncbi:hypothetical protein BN1723_008094 [Verticillium longisporum]|uniref:BRCT domain-containing protein n=1 Tax=Verticillium longisporum TaxID=100787 RepID=A0A0G4NQI8_VERLO|nr:hypothetical protein BN1723_008094 [Verticillium longisporum]
MNRPQLLSHGLRRLRPVQVRSGTRGIVTAADVDKARQYCQRQLQHSDYDAHLIQRTLPAHVRDAYLALRTLNLELVRLPEVVTNPTIGAMRMQFWRESIDKTFAGNPPAEPTCVLLHEAVTSLQSRSSSGGSGSGSARAAATQMKFWIQRVIRTRERHMDNRPFATLASLEEYAEKTYATLMYATLAALPVQSVHADHLASHIGKAAGIVAVLRGVPNAAEIDFAALETQWQLKPLETSGPEPGEHDRAKLLCCMTGFEDPDERHAIIEKINDNGGVYTGDLTKRVTHLIVCKPEGLVVMVAGPGRGRCLGSLGSAPARLPGVVDPVGE